MKEAKARIKINKFLENAGWRFFDSEQGKANIHLESNVQLTEQVLNDIGEDFEKTKNGLFSPTDFDLVISDESHRSIGGNFANNNLNGHTSFRDGYISSKTRVCVTVE